MKLGYFLKNIGISGGVKVMVQHVRLLRDLGIDALLLTHEIRNQWSFAADPVVVVKEDLSDLPPCDFYVGTTFRDVAKLYRLLGKEVVHLCQGYEAVEFRARLSGESVTERYTRKGLTAPIERYLDRLKFKRRIKEIEAAYQLPTIKSAVSKHLVELIQRTYNQDCTLIRNGVDNRIFFADGKRIWAQEGRIRILSVGSINVGVKGIPDTLEAMRILKEKGVNVELIRVSPADPSEKEKNGDIVSRFYSGISEQEMAELYRSVDVFISSSLEGEGFGLPAVEALLSGVPSILTEISTYCNLNEKNDFAYFTPPHSPERIADGVLRFVSDPHYRNSCRMRGLDVAKGYTLEAVKRDLSCFIEILGSLGN